MSESALQMKIVQAIRASGLCVFSVPNEALGKIRARGDRNRIMRLKSMGMLSGVSDLVVVLKNKVLFLEVKTDRGLQSEKQTMFQETVESLGHEYFVVHSVEEALSAISGFHHEHRVEELGNTSTTASA